MPGPSPDLEHTLAQYGLQLGIAFQIADDLLDVLGDEATVGKSLGTDLAKQKSTLPLIRVLQQADAAERSEVVAVALPIRQPSPRCLAAVAGAFRRRRLRPAEGRRVQPSRSGRIGGGARRAGPRRHAGTDPLRGRPPALGPNSPPLPPGEGRGEGRWGSVGSPCFHIEGRCPMGAQLRKRGFSRIELLVVILIIGVLIALIPVWLNTSHETSRRMVCSNNMKQIGLALQAFHNSNNHFPGSGQLDVLTESSVGKHTVGGWSFLVMILPVPGIRNYVREACRQRGHGNLAPVSHLP